MKPQALRIARTFGSRPGRSVQENSLALASPALPCWPVVPPACSSAATTGQARPFSSAAVAFADCLHKNTAFKSPQNINIRRPTESHGLGSATALLQSCTPLSRPHSSQSTRSFHSTGHSGLSTGLSAESSTGEASSSGGSSSAGQTGIGGRGEGPAAGVGASKKATRQSIEDLLAWEHLFSEEELAVRDMVRGWVRERFQPHITEAHRQGSFPRQLIPELAQLGLFGAGLQGYGCAGLGAAAYGLVLQELERGDSGLRSLCSVQGSLVMYAIHSFGSEEQRRRWLPRLASGQLLGCFGLTEAGAGSDPAAMATTARRKGSGWVLDGMKAWITNAPIADLAVVWAKVPEEDGRVRGFVVERSESGTALSTPEISGKWSLRASPTGEIHLTGCHLPAENLLPGSGGLKSPLQCLSQARHGIGWGVTGAALDCFEAALDYGMQRVAFGRPIAATQLFQAQLADMATLVVQSQLTSLHYARLKDAGKLTPTQVSLHKRHNVAAARKVASMARGMLGAVGISDAFPVMRHIMNLESVYTYEGTHEVHSLALGRALTGLNAF